MLLSSLLLIPIIGIFVILLNKDNEVSLTNIKFIALSTSIINLIVSLIIFILFDFSTNQFQFVQEYHEIGYFDFYLCVDGLSIYFVLLGSLFLLLSILAMASIMSTTDFDTLFKGNFVYLTQLFLFYGIFIAFAVKTPTIFLNT